MNVYGDVDDHPINEDHELSLQSFYGVGKAACESYIKIYSKLGLNASIFRLFNIWSGSKFENMKQGMLSIYCSYIWKNRQFGQGSEEGIEILYIDDVVRFFLCPLHLPVAMRF